MGHEVRCRYQKGSLRQHRPLRWYHHVPWNRRPNAEGNLSLGPVHHEDQDHRATRAKVLCVDWWLYFGVPLYLPTDVDLKAGVRRVWTIHRPPKVLLSFLPVAIASVYFLSLFLKISLSISKKFPSQPFSQCSSPSTQIKTLTL